MALRQAAAVAEGACQHVETAQNKHRPNSHTAGTDLLNQRRQENAKTVPTARGAGSFLVVPTDVESAEKQPSSPSTDTLRIYPDLLLGMLREEQVAIGRIWLLCRHLDSDGRGWLDLAFLRDQLTGKSSPLRVVGKRRLRQILADGAGAFWERDEQNRLWLYGVARVAAKLNVERLIIRPIALPISHLITSLAHTRAHCYAAFHSGRDSESDSDLGNPISRATLTMLCGVDERTQRRYDTLAGVETRTCIAIGAPYNKANHAETVWQQGGGTFILTDRRGLQGRAGTTYTAWQLPNQYQRCHARLPKGRQRKLNQQLRLLTKNHADLVTQRARGNDMATQKETAGKTENCVRRFFENGQAAIKARSGHPVYWFDHATREIGVWRIHE